MEAQREEDHLLEEVHRTLSFDVLMRRDVSPSTTPDTVDSKRVWGRSASAVRGPSYPGAGSPTANEENGSAVLKNELLRVTRELEVERERRRSLEADVENLKRIVAGISSLPSQHTMKEQTPLRPISNILLRESTQKLLREAEEELFNEEEFSFQS